MADQESLPNIAGPGIGGFLRTRTWRNLLGRDVVEKQGIIQPVDGLVLWHRLLEQVLPVAVAVQRAIALDRAGGKAREIRLRHDVDVEQHVGKTVAAEMR